MSNPSVRMPPARARSEPIAKLFALKKIAQSARDCRSHLCAHGALHATHYKKLLPTRVARRRPRSLDRPAKPAVRLDSELARVDGERGSCRRTAPPVLAKSTCGSEAPARLAGRPRPAPPASEHPPKWTLSQGTVFTETRACRPVAPTIASVESVNHEALGIDAAPETPRDRRFGRRLTCLGRRRETGEVDAIRAALRTRDFERAIERSRSALRQAPNDPRLWTLQGIALASMGKRGEALQSFQQALKIDPNDMAALEGAAQLHFETGSRRAVPLLNRVLQRAAWGADCARDACRTGGPGGRQRQGGGQGTREGRCVLIDFATRRATCSGHLPRAGACSSLMPRSPSFSATVALQPENPRERKLLAAVQLMAGKPEDAIATLSPMLQGPQPRWRNPRASRPPPTKNPAIRLTRWRPCARRFSSIPRNVDLYLDFANIAFAHRVVSGGHRGAERRPRTPARRRAAVCRARGAVCAARRLREGGGRFRTKASELDPNQALSAAAQGLAAVQENDLDRASATIQGKLAQKAE